MIRCQRKDIEKKQNWVVKRVNYCKELCENKPDVILEIFYIFKTHFNVIVSHTSY